jgi:hypothetical protein
VAYVGFLLGVGAISLVTPPEYEHASRLHWGLIVLAWSLLALISITVSTTSLALTYKQLRRWVRWMTLALNLPVAITLAAGLQSSILSLEDYAAGLTAYQTAVRVCGQPPVLASAGWGGDVLLPSDSDYRRLRYSPADHSLLGTPVYYCTLADAEAHGYKRAAWHQ